MKSKTNYKSKIIAMMVALFLVLSNFSLTLVGLTKKQLFKEKIEAYSTDVSLSNSNFESPSLTKNSTLPATDSDWTSIDKPDTITAGIITLNTEIATAEKIENSYKLSTLPREYTGMPDKQVLMINAGETEATTGFKSSSVSLASAGHFVISFWAYVGENAVASARISGNEELELTENILTMNSLRTPAWVPYKIYLETSSNNAVSINLELWLGIKGLSASTGAVFFDNIEIKNYDANTFNSLLSSENVQLGRYKYINLEKNYVNNFLENASFENALDDDNWKLIEKTNLHSTKQVVSGRFNVENFNSTDTKIEDEVKNTTISGNRYALLINNLEEGYVGYQSAYFTLQSKTLYKLSFLAKTGKISGDAVVKLNERNPYTNEFLSNGTANPNYYNNSSYEEKSFELNGISTVSYTNDLTNDWKTYSFYIKSNSLIDVEANLEISVGTADTNAKGYALFDNFTLQKITSNEYTTNVSNGTEANFNQNNEEMKFANGTFNLFTIEQVDSTYPYKPESWTLSSRNEYGVKNGIVNTSFNNTSIGIPAIPAINENYPNNNVLMIGNTTTNNQKWTSQSVSLEENSYAKITLNVLTTELVDAKAGVQIVLGSTILGEITNIDTNGEWKTYTIFVKNSYEANDIKIVLSLGENKQGRGYAFFDNVILTDSLAEEDYSTLPADKKINLVKNDWTNTPSVSTEIQGIYTPNAWTASNNGTANDGAITSGVINTTKYGLSDGFNESSFDAPGHPENESPYVLMIKATDDSFYTYKSDIPSKLAQGSYYRISVLVKTDRLSQSEDNAKFKDSEETTKYPFGATINVDGIDATFTGIDTNGEWKTYTIYINCTTESNIYLELSLGSANALTRGVVYYSSTSIEQIDAKAFSNGVAVLENDSTISNVLAVGNTDVETDEEETPSKDSTGEVSFNWLLVPSIITGLAILIAVVGAVWRNTRKKSKKVVVKKPYSKEEYKRLEQNYKIELGQLKEQKLKLQGRQNHIAEKLNEAKRTNSDNAEKLEEEYLDIGKKIEQNNQKQADAKKKYKQRVDELKAIKTAEQKRKTK